MNEPDVAIKVISLAGSLRRRRMAEQLDALKLGWTFFDALTTPPLDIPYRPDRARQKHGRELTNGELGCFASHRAVWETAAQKSEPPVTLVLEDDLLLDPCFFRNIAQAASAAEQYQYVRLYGKVPSGIRREAFFLDRHLVRFLGEAHGTQAYFISRTGARAFLTSIREVVRPVDNEMDRYWAHGVLNRAVFPYPLIEVNYGSTIEPHRHHRSVLGAREQIVYTTNRAIEKVRRNFAALLR
jgi:glycosyl transferase family 25